MTRRDPPAVHAAHRRSLTVLAVLPGLNLKKLAIEAGENREALQLDRLLERQQRAALPVLYGMRAPSQEPKGDHVQVGVSEVVDQGRTVVVLFSAVNPQERAIEILPPQIQLAGKVRRGLIVRRNRWGTSEQLPVTAYRLSRRRLGTGERADGVEVFTRPNFKCSRTRASSCRSPKAEQ